MHWMIPSDLVLFDALIFTVVIRISIEIVTSLNIVFKSIIVYWIYSRRTGSIFLWLFSTVLGGFDALLILLSLFTLFLLFSLIFGLIILTFRIVWLVNVLVWVFASFKHFPLIRNLLILSLLILDELVIFAFSHSMNSILLLFFTRGHLWSRHVHLASQFESRYNRFLWISALHYKCIFSLKKI